MYGDITQLDDSFFISLGLLSKLLDRVCRIAISRFTCSNRSYTSFLHRLWWRAPNRRSPVTSFASMTDCLGRGHRFLFLCLFMSKPLCVYNNISLSPLPPLGLSQMEKHCRCCGSDPPFYHPDGVRSRGEWGAHPFQK